MAQIKQEDIIAKYQDLPEDLQKALVSSSFSNAITEVGKKNGLAIDKVGELADETGLVMLGITSPSDYVKNLVKRLGVEQEKARAIAEEINQKIFQPVRESLKKIHGIAVEVKKPEAPKKEVSKAAPQPLPNPLLRKEGGKEIMPLTNTLPPYEGGREGLGVKKPLPKREDIAAPPLIPPIFVKKMPEPIIPKQDIIPPPKEPVPQDSLTAKSALEKELSTPPSPRPQQYKEKDPYREIIE